MLMREVQHSVRPRSAAITVRALVDGVCCLLIMSQERMERCAFWHLDRRQPSRKPSMGAITRRRVPVATPTRSRVHFLAGCPRCISIRFWAVTRHYVDPSHRPVRPLVRRLWWGRPVLSCSSHLERTPVRQTVVK
jgi:hypothetical protein